MATRPPSLTAYSQLASVSGNHLVRFNCEILNPVNIRQESLTGGSVTGKEILPVVLNGCETRSLTLREENRLGDFENSVLRRIFGPKRDEVTGKWKRLHKK